MSKAFTRQTFDPKLFNEVLNGGSTYRLAYLKANLCPNKGDRGGHVPDCPVCKGLGYYWTPGPAGVTAEYELTRAGLYADSERLPGPSTVVSIVDEDGITYPPESVSVTEDGTVTWVEGQPKPADYRLYTVTVERSQLRGLVQGVTTQREFSTSGEYDALDIQLTVDRHLEDGTTLNPAWDAGEHDRVVLLDTWRRHTQHLQRGVQDACVYRRVRDVRLTTVVNGALVTYEAGTDYTLDDGVVTWLAGRGPKVRAFYALEAQVSPEYYVFQVLPQTRHMDGQQMPRRYVLRGFERHPSQKSDVRIG